MLNLRLKRTPVEVTGEAFGVGVRLSAADRGLLQEMISWLPPQWHEGGDGVHPASFSLTQTAADAYELDLNGSLLKGLSRASAIDEYERALRNHIAAAAPAEHVFIHAGVVAHAGRAIVIPGPSFSGKTTLVSALVEAGASYLSDEYAVIGRDGLVHPYPKPISKRVDRRGTPKQHHLPQSLGAVVADRPTPLGMVACTQYRRGAEWDPEEITPAQAALELLQHSRAPQDRARDTLASLAAAATGTVALRGPRGDAAATAVALITRLEQGEG